ncbi:ubiquitin-activating emzyme E1 [Linnemannia elongata AG-77]|uniref:Ubiquitin-activating enzyme E1 1 n=1 Tax=Linnemannia elongata AG-77 TaxID=1314771 RepID=A0A197JWY9_9FUNG|nr:ubiquitin-activating emzyme E1 [Linnemannia elongata AG-77]
MLNMDIEKDNVIDEGLYSRQLYVLGHEAMKKMGTSNILIIGLKGLGIEIAKNVVLAGVKSVTLYDPAPVELTDLSTQFFLTMEDIGKPRDVVSRPRLAELNAYVPIRVLEGELTTDKLSQFKVIVMTESSLEKQLEINEFAHAHNIHFISAEVHGLFASAFNDFGKGFTVVDVTGEEALSGMIAEISTDKEGIVTCLDETRHGLEDGDHVTFVEVNGMEALNGCAPRKVKVLGPYTFSIGDTSDLGNYVRGGLFQQVKMPKQVDFLSLKESIQKPEFLITDFGKFDRPAQLHVGFQALHAFKAKHGRQPRPRNAEDAKEVFALANEINDKATEKAELDEKLIHELSYQAVGDLSPIIAVIGGTIAQEVLKACTGKFSPIHQWMYFDSLESLPTSVTLTEESCQPIGSRHDPQIAVFGREFQERIENFREFLVGAGAIGCEMLKNWAMMGLGTGPNGQIHITDMDTIEKSNLNRQFLFRPTDVGKLKSRSAAEAIAKMNPATIGHVHAYEERVGVDSEKVYGDEFFANLDGVTNALDNLEARKYMDRRCVYFRKSLLESGTLGTKGNVQVVVPFVTESYSSSQDPPETSIPLCTLKNFPNAIEHTIQWARDAFEGFFKQPAENANLYLSQPNYIEGLLKDRGNSTETLKNIEKFLVSNKPLTFEECITWARLQFEEQFNNNIQQLLFNFPKDSVTSTGTLFWSAPKRPPTPLEFNIDDPSHLEFIIAAANLHAFNYGLKGETNPEVFRQTLAHTIVPEFKPKSGVKIQVTESETMPTEESDQADLQKLIDTLPAPSTLAGYRLHPVEFEKDDDTNFHIDFITATSNLRASNYGINPADKHRTKFIAGRIIPAIATTTAMVTGLVCLELYKIIDGRDKIDDYKNGFVNLALPFFGFSEPIAAPKFKYHETEFTLWDRFEIHEDVTLQEFLDHFKEKHELDIAMVSAGVSMLYTSFMQKDKKKERLPMKFSKLVETVSRKPTPAHVRSFTVEVVCYDREGEDVEVPYVVVNFR